MIKLRLLEDTTSTLLFGKPGELRVTVMMLLKGNLLNKGGRGVNAPFMALPDLVNLFLGLFAVHATKAAEAVNAFRSAPLEEIHFSRTPEWTRGDKDEVTGELIPSTRSLPGELRGRGQTLGDALETIAEQLPSMYETENGLDNVRLYREPTSEMIVVEIINEMGSYELVYRVSNRIGMMFASDSRTLKGELFTALVVLLQTGKLPDGSTLLGKFLSEEAEAAQRIEGED